MIVSTHRCYRGSLETTVFPGPGYENNVIQANFATFAAFALPDPQNFNVGLLSSLRFSFSKQMFCFLHGGYRRSHYVLLPENLHPSTFTIEEFGGLLFFFFWEEV